MLFIRKLRWDDWNIDHIAKHDVTPDEVEKVCHKDSLLEVGKKGRLLIIGLVDDKRMITVVLDHEGKGRYYPVTARPASRKERKLYKEQKGVKEDDKK